MTTTITVTLIHPAGTHYRLAVDIGQSIMEAAILDGVPGILAECGGAPQCGTCSVFVTPPWAEQTGTADDIEANVLAFNGKQGAHRRLSCQLIAQEHWDGLTLQIPEHQY